MSFGKTKTVKITDSRAKILLAKKTIKIKLNILLHAILFH